MKPTPLSQILARIDAAYPKATLLHVRVVLALAAARNRTMSQPDLSQALGRGRDSTAVQGCVARLVRIGIVTREMEPASDSNGQMWLIRLASAMDEAG